MTLTDTLGWTLLHFLWQGALIALALGLADAVLRNATARARYAAACGALVLMLASAAGTFTWLSPGAAPAAVPVSAYATVPMPPAPPAPLWDAPATLAGAGVERTSNYLPFLVYFWFAGVCALAARSFGGWVMVQRLARRASRPADEVWQRRLTRLAARLQITRALKLRESALAEVPAVIGWLRPVVLLPGSVMSGLSPQQLEALLAHELAHIRRHDYLVNLLQTAVETLLFYHPAVWWVGKRIRAERENCCDDLAVEVCGDALSYARALARLEQLRGGVPQLAMASNHGSLLERIQRLVGTRPASGSVRAGWKDSWLGAAPALLLLLAFWLAPHVAVQAGLRQQPAVEPVAVELPVAPMPAAAPRPAPAPQVPAEPQVPVEPRVEPAPAASPAPDPAPALFPAPAVDPVPAADPAPAVDAAPAVKPEPSPAPKPARVAKPPAAVVPGSVIGGTVGGVIGGVADGVIAGAVDGVIAGVSDGLIAGIHGGVASGIHSGVAARVSSGMSTGIRGRVADEVRGHVASRVSTTIRNRVLPAMAMQASAASAGQAAPASGDTETNGFIDGLSAAGYNDLTVDQLIQLKIHGVTPEYARRFQATGLQPTADQLVKLRIHGVTPEYIEETKEAGLDLTLDQLIKFRIHGVDLAAVKEMTDLGYKLSAGQMVKMRVHGLTPELARQAKQLGFGDPTFDQLIKMRIHGITREYAAAMQQAGLSDLNFERLVKLRIHGADAEQIREVRELGFSDLSANDVVKMRVHGVSPEFIRAARHHFPDLSLDKLIKLKQLGIIAEPAEI